MSKYQVDQIRNIVLCGHGSAGKTTLLDTLLHKTGAVKRPASVDDGTSICDFDEEEKHHKYTIEATVTHFDHAGKHFHAIDTPGYPDFIGQAIGAMRGADTAVVVINAQAGIEVNTRRVFAEAEKAGLGRIIVLNKMDSDNIDFPALVELIGEVFGGTCQLLNIPVGHGSGFTGVVSTLSVPGDTNGALIDPNEVSQALLESIIEVDEAVMERYFEGQLPTQEELSRLIVKAVAQGTLVPILCCSSKTGVGLPELLDGLGMCSLPPDAVRRTANNAEGVEVEIQADPAGPLVAQVFKTRIDPFVQKISFVRVFSGTLREGETVPMVGHRKGVKLSQLNHAQADQLESIAEIGPGGICAIAKIEDLETGVSLGELTMSRIPFPVPMVGLAVTPKSRGDEAKLSGALHKIVQEDPTFRLDRDLQTKEIVATGMSELHLQIIQERLKRRDKVEVETKEPKIPYRETIQATAEGMYRHKKQTGGRGQFGEVHIRMFPFPKETPPEEYCTKARFASMREYHYDEKNNFVWIDSVVGGTIPSNFLPAIEKGFKERIVRGVIAGYQVQNVAVEVHFGKYHPVDSSEAAFKMAGSMAFRNVFQQAKPGLLEPIVKIDITIPAGNVGDINSDLSGRRGRVLGMDAAGGGMQTITAEVPLAEVMTYARSLSSITGGQGSYAIEFSHYDVVPGNVQQEIVAKAKLEEEEEE
ncbi:MAG: elongation factor G [Patescibacteria group bacterium]|nr:elongation factor G [Patescibacteria group bacterium]